jgi:tetratricopeptide (TPR) repeat protein
MEPIADSGNPLDKPQSAEAGERSRRRLKRLNQLTGLLTIFLILVVGLIAFMLVTKRFERPKTYHEEQLRIWGQVVAQDPQNPMARTRIGQIRLRMGQTRRAVAELESVLKDFPQYINAHYHLGVAYQQQDDYDKAEEQLLKALSLIEDERAKAQPAYRLASVYQDKDQPDKAIEYYELAAKAEPLLWNPHFELGRLFEQKGDLEQALSHYEDAAKFNPEEKLEAKIKNLNRRLKDRN